jgi:hypothetical protein
MRAAHKTPDNQSASAKATQPRAAGGPKKTVIDVIREAYDSNLIEKEEYDKALYKLLKKEVTGDQESRENSVTEFKIFENDGKVEMIVERGEVDIPANSNIEIKREGGHLSIRSKVHGAGNAADAESKEEIPTPLPQQESSGTKDVFDPAELEAIEKEFQSAGGSQEISLSKETTNIREDLELIDLRREFKKPEEEEKTEASEEKKKEEEPGLLDGIIDKLSKLTGRLREEGKAGKLKRMSLENLNKIKEVREERRAIIGVAYVLKQFLQVRFNIPHEVTYHELVEELKGRDIDNELKNQLMEFFRRMPVMMYARVPLNESLPKAYNIAERAINELSAGVE